MSLPLSSRMDRQRWTVLGIWLLGLMIAYALVLHTDFSLFHPPDPPETLRDPITKLYGAVLALYAPYLTLMLAIGFAKEHAGSKPPSRIVFIVAIAVSLFWNGVVLWETAEMSYFHRLEVQALSEWMSDFSKDWSFIVTPMVALYFTSERP
jgi:hypothetical protein